MPANVAVRSRTQTTSQRKKLQKIVALADNDERGRTGGGKFALHLHPPRPEYFWPGRCFVLGCPNFGPNPPSWKAFENGPRPHTGLVSVIVMGVAGGMQSRQLTVRRKEVSENSACSRNAPRTNIQHCRICWDGGKRRGSWAAFGRIMHPQCTGNSEWQPESRSNRLAWSTG